MRLWIGVGDHTVNFFPVVLNILPFRVARIYKFKRKTQDYSD